MVHKKYTWRGGRKYGPYLYENKRVNGKVVTFYIGKEHDKNSRIRPVVYGITICLLLAVSLLIVRYNFSPTGKAAFDVSLDYKEGEMLAGDLGFKVKGGELIPAASEIVILLKEIPDLRIVKGKAGKLDLTEYFSGAEKYEFEGKNLQAEFEGNELTLIPEEGFSGEVRGKITAFGKDEELESNIFNVLVSSGAVSVKTSQEKIKVGELVKWKKEISLESSEKLEISIPAGAENIAVKKIENGIEKKIDASIISNDGIVIVKSITGEVVIELELKKKRWTLFGWFKGLLSKMTGRAVSEEGRNNLYEDTGVILNGFAKEYIIEYETKVDSV